MTNFRWIDILKEYFQLELDEHFQIYKHVNKEYKGGDVVSIRTSPRKILDFLEEIDRKNPEYFSLIKEVIIRWGGEGPRGWGYLPSFLILDQEFAKSIKLQGYFKWVDKGWGDFTAALTYDLSNL